MILKSEIQKTELMYNVHDILIPRWRLGVRNNKILET
jgi:hypothetical protein